jgi:uncharacterized membrane protein YfcA
VQGLSGFAFGMVAMSFWVWGIDPKIAAVMTVFGSLIGQLIAAFSIRREWRIAVLFPFLLGGLLGLPFGVAVLPYLDPGLFKLMLGLVLVVWCPVMLFSAQLPAITKGGRAGDALAGAAGGFMGGLGGLTGVVPSLWCTLRGFDKDMQRTIMQNFNLAALSVTMAIYMASGIATKAMLPEFGIVTLALLIPSFFGAKAYIGLSEQAFRKIVLVLLTASGIAMLASLLPQFLR